MPEFPYARLRRFPDVEAKSLQAWDATDELLVRAALDTATPGKQISVIGDRHGAITLALTAEGRAGVRVDQDLVTGRRALANNARELGIGGFSPQEWGPELLRDATLVLLPFPQSLAELTEIADGIARWASPDAVVIAGGRVKHMTLSQNEVLGRFFSVVQPQRAERKSRLVLASGARPVSEELPFPELTAHPALGLTLAAHGGAFASSRIDIGTRVLLEQLPSIPEVRAVVDLGCGTGALAAAYALRHPHARVIATDRSAAAVRSARATMRANGLDDRVTVTLDDAGSELPEASIDLVLLNPPFHLGTSIHTAAASRLFAAASRVIRSGGELWCVYNSALSYRPELGRLIGPTEQIHRTPKFTVTRSVRR